MNITSQQKKTLLPAASAVFFGVIYLYSLGSIWAVFWALPMIFSVMALVAWNVDRWVKAISAWGNRDGWK